MKTVILRLKSFGNSSYGYVFAKKKGDPLLCRDTLSDFFTLPRNKSTPISFVISGKKLPNSYKVKFDGNQVSIFYGGTWVGVITFFDAKSLLRMLRLKNKEFWVSLYWEE